MAVEHFDVLILGAGISGVGAACHLERESPGRNYAILERRERLGGTWDLFRYPGIRSDSDMFTFGYNFRPWNETTVLADGPSIRSYVAETAAEYGVDKHIRFGLQVVKASWSSETATWTVEARREQGGRAHRFTANFVIACTGYYNYDAAYRPEFPGEERFGGPIVHPQFWPEDLDYRGKRVVVIGSGATAVTLVPAMAGDAAHVTMLQRSPTYIMSLPAVDKATERLKRVLPGATAFRLARRRNIGLQRAIYVISRTQPAVVKRIMLRAVEQQLKGTSDVRHFTPTYKPWDQRLCVVPNGDLFKTIRSGRADVVTDTIETFTEKGIKLASGAELDADIIITATGLDIQMLGGASIEIDGEPLALNQKLTYKAVMLEDVPNAAIVFGYTNASWTLKADIAAEYVCRLLNFMDRNGYAQVVAQGTGAERATESVQGSLTSGYVRRGNDRMPRQGKSGPWRVRNDYLRDAAMLRMGAIDDGILQFRRAGEVAASAGRRDVATA